MRLRLFDEIEARLSRVRVVNGQVRYCSMRHGQTLPGVPAINHVGLWNEDTTRLTQIRPFAPPGVFVEFMPTTWSQLGRNVVHADVAVRLHIVTSTLAATDTPWRDEALERFRLIREIKKAFVRFSGAPDKDGRSFSAFRHLDDQTDHNHGQVSEDLEEWITHCIDASSAVDDDDMITTTDNVSLGELNVINSNL